MELDIQKIEVKVKFIEEKKLKAIIALNLYGCVVVKGFRVAESEFANENGDKLWLTPPSYRDGGGHYHPIFFMPDKELWKQLERRIWGEYYRQRDEHYRKRFDLPKKVVDLTDDDIPMLSS